MSKPPSGRLQALRCRLGWHATTRRVSERLVRIVTHHLNGTKSERIGIQVRWHCPACDQVVDSTLQGATEPAPPRRRSS